MTSPEPLRQLAGRQVFARFVRDDVSRVFDDARADLEPLLRPGETVMAELPDGTVIGQVQRKKPSTSGQVVDEPALLAWVKEHRPDEVTVRTVESVNAAYVKKLCEQAKTDGVPCDPETGEVIPGVEARRGTSAYAPSVDADAEPTLRARLSELIGSGLLKIEQSTEEAS